MPIIKCIINNPGVCNELGILILSLEVSCGEALLDLKTCLVPAAQLTAQMAGPC